MDLKEQDVRVEFIRRGEDQLDEVRVTPLGRPTGTPQGEEEEPPEGGEVPLITGSEAAWEGEVSIDPSRLG